MKYFLILLFLMGLLRVNAQDAIVRDPAGLFISFSPGIWVPVGNLKRTFGSSPKLNFGLGAQGKKVKLQIVGEIVFNGGNQPFNYASKDTSFVSGQNLTMGSLGLQVGRMKKLSATSYLEKFVGMGYSSISMDVKKLKSECTGSDNHVWHFGENNCEGSSKYNFQSLESFYVTAGVGLQKIIFRKRVLGVQAAYRFTPYSWFGKVEKGFGDSVVSTSINFRF